MIPVVVRLLALQVVVADGVQNPLAPAEAERIWAQPPRILDGYLRVREKLFLAMGMGLSPSGEMQAYCGDVLEVPENIFGGLPVLVFWQ